jgi:hypothetical protein
MSNAFEERNRNVGSSNAPTEQVIDEATGEPIDVPIDESVDESVDQPIDAVSEAPMPKISSNYSMDFMNNYNTNPEFAAMVDEAGSQGMEGSDVNGFGRGDSQNLQSPTMAEMAKFNNDQNVLNKFTSADEPYVDPYGIQEGLPTRQVQPIDQNTNYPDKIEMPAELKDWQNKQLLNNSNNQVVNNKTPRQGANQNNFCFNCGNEIPNCKSC